MDSFNLNGCAPIAAPRNPGPKKNCINCGAPQPENVQFERAAEEKLVTDAEALKAAQAGADYMCPYCGTRNSATAKVCVQCGGDLVEAKRRAAGAELQANTGPKEVTCTNCGTVNPSSRSNCSKCGAPLPRDSVDAQIAATAQASAATPKKPSRWWLWAGLAAALAAVRRGHRPVRASDGNRQRHSDRCSLADVRTGAGDARRPLLE